LRPHRANRFSRAMREKERNMRLVFNLTTLGLLLAAQASFGQTATTGAGAATGGIATQTAAPNGGSATTAGSQTGVNPNGAATLNPNGGVNTAQRFATPSGGPGVNANGGTASSTQINRGATNPRMSGSNMSGQLPALGSAPMAGPGTRTGIPSANGVAGQTAAPNMQTGVNAGASGMSVPQMANPNVANPNSALNPNLGVAGQANNGFGSVNGQVTGTRNINGAIQNGGGIAAPNTDASATVGSVNGQMTQSAQTTNPNGQNPNVNTTGQANSGFGSVNGQVTGTRNLNGLAPNSGGTAAPNTDASANIGSINGQMTQSSQTQPMQGASGVQNANGTTNNNWRMVNQSGRWWYWAPGNYWMAYDGATWTRYNQPAAVPFNSSTSTTTGTPTNP